MRSKRREWLRHYQERWPDWGMGLLLLGLGVFTVVNAVASGASLLRLLGAILIAVFFSVFGLMAFSNLRGRRNAPGTMAHFDFFGRIRPWALTGLHGSLALATRVLHQNIEPLKGEFTVVTTAGHDRERLPKGRGVPLHPYWIALVANRIPVGLFFFRGWGHPFVRALVARESEYRLHGLYEDRGVYYYPELLVRFRSGAVRQLGEFRFLIVEPIAQALGLGLRGPRVQRRLPRRRVDERRIQAIVDEFVSKQRARSF